MNGLSIVMKFAVLCLLALLVCWIVLSSSHYTNQVLTPNGVFVSDGRRYTCPNLEIIGTAYLLKDSHVAALRKVALLTRKALQAAQTLQMDQSEEHGIQSWPTGGTLMGIVKHAQVPMPFDDDVDFGVSNEHRKYLFSQKFVDHASAFGLRVFYLRGASSTSANRTGACVRTQLVNHPATLDIFFWKSVQDKVIKLDGWSGEKDIYNEKEQFAYTDVYPLQKDVTVDELTFDLPNNPVNLLIQQYGPSVLTKIIARSTFVSHLFPFVAAQFLWTSQAPG